MNIYNQISLSDLIALLALVSLLILEIMLGGL
jgi:hypothetical protein